MITHVNNVYLLEREYYADVARLDPFQDAMPCWQFKRYHLHKAHGREFICSVMSTETLVKLAFPYSNIEHAELDADVFIISPGTVL